MSEKIHVIAFSPDGSAKCVYTDDFPLSELGKLNVKRASTVEFNPESGEWEVRFGEDPKAPVQFSHPSRTECIKWEVETLQSVL